MTDILMVDWKAQKKKTAQKYPRIIVQKTFKCLFLFEFY